MCGLKKIEEVKREETGKFDGRGRKGRITMIRRASNIVWSRDWWREELEVVREGVDQTDRLYYLA